MPKTKKFILPKNLLQNSVYIEDTTQNSVYFNVSNIQSVFTGGRNSFLINGSSYLQNGSIIETEIIDQTGKTVYHVPVKDYIEAGSRLISVEIIDDITPGPLTIVIVGTIKSTVEGTPIPTEWQNKPNVRWIKKVFVEPKLKNTSPIILVTKPTITVQENRFFNTATSSFSQNNLKFTGSITAIRDSGKLYGISGYLIQTETPSTFSAAYENIIITGSLLLGSNISSIQLPITKVLNEKTAFSENSRVYKNVDFERIDDKIYEHEDVVKELLLSGGTYPYTIDGIPLTITTQPTFSFSQFTSTKTNIPISYANIRVTNLSTVSGEIVKFKVYNKVATSVSDYKLIADIPVVTNEILVSSSIQGNIPIGNFYIASASNDWYSDKLTSTNNVIYPISGTIAYYDPTQTVSPFTLTNNNSTLLKSIFTNVPTDNNKFANSVSSSGYFIGTKRPVLLSPTTEYTLQLNAYYKKTSGSVTLEGITPNVDIYLLGSGTSKLIDNNPLGQKIGTLKIVSGQPVKWFENVQFNFFPKLPTDGTVYLRLVISNGFWNFADISIKPASDTMFSPDECQILVPNVEYHNENLQYKIEFTDVNGNSTTVKSISNPTYFSGSQIDLGVLP